MSDERERDLERFLTQCVVEYVADVDGPGEWRFRGGLGNASDPYETYDVDPDIDTGPVVLVRRSDGARFKVEASVSVAPECRQRGA